MLEPNGRLYFSVSVGQADRICFNAHRVFKPQTIIGTLDQIDIVEMNSISNELTTIEYITHKNGKNTYWWESCILYLIKSKTRAMQGYLSL